MSDQFVAEIRIFPFNFAPRDWAMCAGQALGAPDGPDGGERAQRGERRRGDPAVTHA